MHRADEKSEPVYAAGARVGLNFSPERRVVPTLRAHRLVMFGRERGGESLAGELVEALFHAYFTEHRLINQTAVLVDVGARCGLLEHDVRSFIESDALEAEVRAEYRALLNMGVASVPFFQLTCLPDDASDEISAPGTGGFNYASAALDKPLAAQRAKASVSLYCSECLSEFCVGQSDF